jgi:hypothetical protein
MYKLRSNTLQSPNTYNTNKQLIASNIKCQNPTMHETNYDQPNDAYVAVRLLCKGKMVGSGSDLRFR